MAYTKAQLDELTSKFEKCAERQEANKTSAVKVRAAERDLLSVAEALRDMCSLAVKGNKDKLADVFGGTCEHIVRILQVLERIELTDMHADDQRWEGCKKQVYAVKQILEDLGSYKPWQIGKAVPESISYPGLQPRFSPGERVTLHPEVEGAAATLFTVSPPLPASLRINKDSGVISGQLKASTEVEEATYVVTASNAQGETQCSLTFRVAQTPPEAITYSGLPEMLYVAETVSFEPVCEGGAAEKWLLMTMLPAGLKFDPETGRISGAATGAEEVTEYVITAENSGGQATVTVKFGVRVAPPVELSYPDAEASYACKAAVHIVPDLKFARSGAASSGGPRKSQVLPGISFAVEPALPSGLELVDTMGFIIGTPVEPTAEATYKVTASNAGGSISTEITFAVKLAPPEQLSYPDAGDIVYVGEALMLHPEVEGYVAEWTLYPTEALEELGLEFDASTGAIQGIPTKESSATLSFTITARNEEGETTSKVLFVVKRAPPSKLAYPSVEGVYPVLRPMSIEPIVDGQVERFSVSPALPTGLTCDESTGVISGTPTTECGEQTYEVKASNESGDTTTKISFSVKVMPPTELQYPGLDELYNVGEEVDMEPQVVGGADQWVVEPDLPKGMVLDPSTGRITGKASETAEMASYVVTASNQEGGTSTVLSFKVTAPAPEGLSYPTVSSEYSTGSSVALEPEVVSGVCGAYTVTPDLPAGLTLDPATGVVSGTPSVAAESCTYTVTLSNIAGSTTADITFSITEVPDLADATDTFATLVERVTDIVELRKMDPSKKRAAGDWMIWMVHRAWLNDPELTIFDFDNLSMPLGHQEPRISPKLMKAMGHNTNIQQLHLNNSNLQKPEGYFLADSLKKNKTLLILGIQSNNLDSDVITKMAQAIQEFPDGSLQQWRFDGQKCCGNNFGRLTEEALASMLEKNTKLLKLGVTLNDPHWRRTCDKLLMRNNDAFRRERKAQQGRKSVVAATEVQPKDRTLSTLMLAKPPAKAAWEVFEDDNEKLTLARKSLAAAKKLPTKEQLQLYAKNAGQPLKFSEVAPLLKEFRCKLIQAFVETEVSVTDTYNSAATGILQAWSETNEKWLLDVWPDSETRFHFKAEKAIVVEVSEEVALWAAGGN